ncbi:hypothetical protein [Calothrix anomala]|uniref:hypothetical protein n=1 Tax=Calothrix anomala TaxID=212351 RepID=UPI0018EFA20A|nr:hypothetical protein [Calothrix anomala]
MNPKLTCPVCDRTDIEGNICPNCQTDLSSVRILMELPTERPSVPILLAIAIALACFIFGFLLSRFYLS